MGQSLGTEHILTALKKVVQGQQKRTGRSSA